MNSKDTKTDVILENEEWTQIIESTMKIKNNNNIKEFSILNLRNNLYFNLKKAKIMRDITEEERTVLERCSYCDQPGSRFHPLVNCSRSFKKVWELITNILKNAGYNFKHLSPTNLFFNSKGDPNGFPSLITLNTNKLIY